MKGLLNICKFISQCFIRQNNNQYRNGNVTINSNGMMIQEKKVIDNLRHINSDMGLINKILSPNSESPQDFITPMVVK